MVFGNFRVVFLERSINVPFGTAEEGVETVLTQQRDGLGAEVAPVYIPLLGKYFASRLSS